MYIVISILLFSFLIFIHELGHFVTAKLSGVQVNEFALFMGPKIFSKKIGETTYRLNCIPIGGYCAMEGEDGESENPRAFTNAATWKRLIILCAGSFMNFLAGFLIILIMTAATTDYIQQAKITSIDDGSDFATIGMEVGDEFYSIDGHRIFVATDLSLLLDRNQTGVFDFVTVRDGEKIEYHQVSMEKKIFESDEDDTTPRYGIQYGGLEKLNFGGLLRYSWNSCRYFSRLVWFGLGDLLTGKAGLNEMGGPVKIVEVVNEAGVQAGSTVDGLLNVLYFFAFIAVNLAVMNMLPIPALDGGRAFALLLTVCIEAIIRKKLNPKIEAYVHGIGMALLLAFMAFITLHDVLGLFR